MQTRLPRESKHGAHGQGTARAGDAGGTQSKSRGPQGSGRVGGAGGHRASPGAREHRNLMCKPDTGMTGTGQAGAHAHTHRAASISQGAPGTRPSGSHLNNKPGPTDGSYRHCPMRPPLTHHSACPPLTPWRAHPKGDPGCVSREPPLRCSQGSWSPLSLRLRGAPCCT